LTSPVTDKPETLAAVSTGKWNRTDKRLRSLTEKGLSFGGVLLGD